MSDPEIDAALALARRHRQNVRALLERWNGCGHCGHLRSWHWNDHGPCGHLAYANGARCNCSQFQPLTTSRDTVQNAAGRSRNDD